jgi:hypothetical protein
MVDWKKEIKLSDLVRRKPKDGAEENGNAEESAPAGRSLEEATAPPPLPQPEPDPVVLELEQIRLRLERKEAALEERERSLNVQAQALAAEAKRLADQKAELERHLDVRDLLRRRAEQEVERLWRTFDDALEAKRAGGEPDYEVRLSAARALLAEAYAAPGDDATDPAELPDELAALRERKVQLR